VTIEVLHERYERLCRESVDMYEHMPTFVQAVDDLHATKVIELGVRYGHSTIAWLRALHGRGQLWSVDCSFPIPANPNGTDLDKVNLLDPQGPLGVMDHWSFILGYDTWPRTLEMLPDEVDIVFIDTNHVYEETHVELDLYYPRVRKGGRIYLHDTALETTGNATTPQPPFPVRTAMEEFARINGLEFDNNPSCFGLGTIYC
jgi:predicted O-methyltransferase YrrM